MKATSVRIDLTHTAWRQLAGINRGLGARFIRAFVLKRELAQYIAAHEAQGIHLDTECLELRYEGGVYLIMRRTQGVWYVTDVILMDAPERFTPVYAWAALRYGVHRLLARLLIGWRETTSSNVQGGLCL